MHAPITAEEESWTRAGTSDTNIDQRFPAGTAARAKIKHPRSARAGCDRHTHHREENLRHRRQMLHESASDAFAVQSNPSKCSWCNTEKLEFYIHCCSTCHAFPRSPMNLDIAPHRHRTRHHTRSSAHPVLLQQYSKLLKPMFQGVCHQRNSVEEHAMLITSVALRDSASALAPSSPMLFSSRIKLVMVTFAWC